MRPRRLSLGVGTRVLFLLLGSTPCFALAGPRPLGALAQDGSRGLQDPPGCFSEQRATGSSAGSAEEREERVWFEQAACFQTDTPSTEVSRPRPALREHALLAAAVWGFPGAWAQGCLRILDPAARDSRPVPRHPPRRCPWAWQRTHSVCVFLGGKRGSVQAAEAPSGSRVLRGHRPVGGAAFEETQSCP